MRDGVHVAVDGIHAGGALGDLAHNAVMKADFQAPDGFIWVIAGVRERVFINGTFPDAFHKGAFVGDVHFLGFVINAHLEADGFAKGVGFALAVDGAAFKAFEVQVADTVVDADGSCPGDEVLGEVLGWFPALKVDRQVQDDADRFDGREEVHPPFGEFVVDLEAGALIEPTGRGFDLDVRALAVGFGVEVLEQDR